MAKYLLAALLCVSAGLAQAQPPGNGVLQPDTDPAARRQAFKSFSDCLARARPRWARQTLSQAYLSKAQAKLASEALVGGDRCVVKGEVDLTFRTSGLIGNLAEYYLAPDVRGLDDGRVMAALSGAPRLNASEDFAICLAARQPAAARDLVASEMGSAAETDAGQRLATGVARCTLPGEHLEVDLQSLRSLTAMALYRGMAGGGKGGS